MSIDAGGIEILSKRLLLCVFLILSLLVACSSHNRQLEGIPVVVAGPGQQATDVELVISNAHKEVQKIIPDAYLVFFSFVGPCQELPRLRGEFRLDFAQNNDNWFRDQIILARAKIITIDQILSIDIRDETEHYKNIEPLLLTGKSTQEIANLLYEYLTSTNRCSDTVVLTRVRTESPWRARCGPPAQVFLECIEIDPESGKVTELR